MSVQINFPLPYSSDGILQVALASPTSISGWTIQWDLMFRPNSPQPIISRFLSSGYSAGQSGITLVDGTRGVFNVAMKASDLSGQEPGNYAFRTHRVDIPSDINLGWRLANN